MAELIIKAVDAAMPTVAAWRAHMALKVPEAQAYLAAHPRTQQAMTDMQRVEQYAATLQRLARTDLPDLERIEAQAAVDAYLANPVSPTDLAFAREQHYTKPEKRAVVNGSSVQVEPEVPSVVTMWWWHTGVIADSQKDNATKGDELATKDQRGCYKRGYICGVYPDGTNWGNEERLPKFVIIKIPGVAVDNPILLKYVQPQLDDVPDAQGTYPTYRRRRWQIRWADLPLAARNKLASTGILTVKAGTYTGPSDYTWAQVKGYFRNLNTGLDETGAL